MIQAIKGLSWYEVDHVIASAYEHNSIRRSMEYIKKQNGVTITFVDTPDNDDETFVKAVEYQIRPNTQLIAMTQASNVM